MARVVSADFLIGPGARVLADHGLVYEGDTILMVGPTAECVAAFPGAQAARLSGCALSPGFVNAHMHLYGVLAHGIVPPVKVESFKGFLEDYWWPLVENLLDAEMVAAAARVSAAELADSGVCSLCDVLEAPFAGGGALDVEAAVLEELGLRAALSSEACERVGLEQGRRVLEENAAFARRRPRGSLVEGLLCTHTAFTCSGDFVREAAALAAELGVSLQFHLSESRYEPDWTLKNYGKRPTQWYEDQGILGPGVLAAQGVQLDQAEIGLLASRGVRLVHVPLSNCEVGGGVSPVPELLAAGATLGLGTDGYVNDFLEVMRGAFLIHKGHREDPTLMGAGTVWRMATEGGADAVWPGRSYGRLAAGSPADFIVLELDDLPTPPNAANLLDQLVLFRQAKHIRESYVAGRPVKLGGKLVAAGDRKAAADRCRVQAARLWEAGRSAAAV